MQKCEDCRHNRNEWCSLLDYSTEGVETHLGACPINAVAKYDKLLEAVETIQTFLEECHCSSAGCWDDNNETVMCTDIGYFFEGLDGLEEYLKSKGAT